MQQEQPIIHAPPKKLTFVLMFHDAEKFGDTPTFEHTIVEERFMNDSQGMALLKTLHDVLKYLTMKGH